METLDYDHTWHQDRQRADGNLWVRFTEDIMEDEQKTRLAGKPVFRDVILIHIMVPGDKRNIVVREIEDRDKERFARQWSAWQKTKSEMPEGTPLREWSGVTRSLAANLVHFGFQTVEQLAAATDGACANFPGLRELKRRAQLYVEQVAGLQPLNQLQAQIDDRDAELAVLREQMASMQATINELAGRSGGTPVPVFSPAVVEPVPGSVKATELIDLGV